MLRPCRHRRLRRARTPLPRRCVPPQNLVQVIGGSWSLEEAHVCIVLELCEQGTLSHLLHTEPSRSSLSWAKHKLRMALGIAQGMAYLHAQRPPVVHRDLKPDNVMFDDASNAKLAGAIAPASSAGAVSAALPAAAIGTPPHPRPALLPRPLTQ